MRGKCCQVVGGEHEYRSVFMLSGNRVRIYATRKCKGFFFTQTSVSKHIPWPESRYSSRDINTDPIGTQAFIFLTHCWHFGLPNFLFYCVQVIHKLHRDHSALDLCNVSMGQCRQRAYVTWYSMAQPICQENVLILALSA